MVSGGMSFGMVAIDFDDTIWMRSVNRTGLNLFNVEHNFVKVTNNKYKFINFIFGILF